jgi:hypothetical protein
MWDPKLTRDRQLRPSGPQAPLTVRGTPEGLTMER